MDESTVARPSPDRRQPSPDRLELSVPEAAERLGLTTDAIRSRLNRGTLPGEKRDGQWRVFFETEPTVEQPSATADRPSDDRRHDDDRGRETDQVDRLIARLEDEIAYLREENQRKDHLLAGLIERLPALPETVSQETTQTQNKAPGRAETAEVGSDASASLWGRLRRWIVG